MTNSRGEIPETAVLPPKQFMTEDQLLEVWEHRGLVFRCEEFWQYCIERGLLPHFRKESFTKKIYGMMRQFLVEGETRRDPRFVPPLKPIKRV